QVQMPAELTSVERRQMYALMTGHYENVEWADFEHDLLEKEWVIVVRGVEQTILGFSTLGRLRAWHRDEPLVALFSGDTVLDPNIWGAGGWARAWGRLAGRLMQEEMDDMPLYWLLLTATHRTYRFLRTFLKEFYPRLEVQTPPEYQELIELFVCQKFPT